MKIAFPSNDGLTINPSFGQAQYYVFVTVENDQEVSREKIEKPDLLKLTIFAIGYVVLFVATITTLQLLDMFM